MMKRVLMCLSATILGAAAIVSHVVDGVAAPLPVVLSASASAGGGDGDGDGDAAKCLICVDDRNCNPNEHDAWEATLPGDGNRKWGDGPHSISSQCEPGTCATKHPVCAFSFADASTEILKASIKRNDVTRIQGLIEAYNNGLVVFNSERSAIQVLNCNKTVIAHFPLSSELSSALNKIAWNHSNSAVTVAE